MAKEIKVETPHDHDGITDLTVSLPSNLTLSVSSGHIGYISGDKKSAE